MGYQIFFNRKKYIEYPCVVISFFKFLTKQQKIQSIEKISIKSFEKMNQVPNCNHNIPVIILI
jgi:hypothetical protein